MMLLGSGLSGLVGSRIRELLSSQYEFDDLSRKTGIDITNESEVLQRIQDSPSPFILHFAAYTDVEQAEKDKHQGEESVAWKINVGGTRNVVEACNQAEKHLIFLSTDMVFPGDQKLGDRYSEDDVKDPTNLYAQTKYEAEQVITSSRIQWTILRIAYPYRSDFTKNDSVRIFLSKLNKKEPIKAVTDHYFTPTFIDDLAEVIDFFVKEKVTGVFHAGGSQTVSPYEIAMSVAKLFDQDPSLISKTTRAEFFQGRAQRPFNLSLNSDKIGKLGIKLSSLDEGLAAIKKQKVFSL